ncbi:MAG: hypothetical protein HFI35_09950 [Roseburia sp.]|nr:hypothetical protein [Roseburia sp.]
MFAVIFSFMAGPFAQYRSAAGLYETGKYAEAAAAFREPGDYKDSRDRLEMCYRNFYGEEFYEEVSRIESAKGV